ncbi:uncharacterized protein [Salvelinus alpinus]|uniref:uncharacterized protein n=1 Tax=Salvelinus alpinus TaxID=8036 RepID=UPI0039FDA52C
MTRAVPPQILHGFGSPSQAPGLDPPLSVNLNDEKTRADLGSSSAEVTDLSLYYCAVEPRVTTPEELVQEGRNVHLSCKYYGIVYNLQWFRQYPRSQPEFLLYITPKGSLLTVSIDKVEQRMVSGESVTPEKEEYTRTEGISVSLRCTYETTSDYVSLYWYKHYPNQAPQFLLYKGARSRSSQHIPDERYTSTTSQTSTELVITKLTLADTALYYCALRDIHSDTKCIVHHTETCRPKCFDEVEIIIKQQPHFMS